MIPAQKALSEALIGVHFPVSKQYLMREYRHKQIYLTADHPSNFEDILKQLPQQKFESLSALAKAIDSVIVRF